MSDLRALQIAVKNAIFRGDASLAAEFVVPTGAGARLAVYRHHCVDSLTEVLAATYPVTRELLGDNFFAHLAESHIASRPPTEPCLSWYGASFATTVEDNRGCASLPYLADVARLEWALH